MDEARAAAAEARTTLQTRAETITLETARATFLANIPEHAFTMAPGLMMAHLHPALALVFVVPFLPGPARDTGMFETSDEVDEAGTRAEANGLHHSPLHNFEHQLKLFVDLGLFFFAMGNAGVELAGIGTMTWIILAALVIGKTVGITLFGLLGKALGFPLPAHMGLQHLIMAGFIAALGLTVALFVAGAAFPMDAHLLGEAKMGALFSGFVSLAAIGIARMTGLTRASKASAES
jgi:NhaA family Na+:H+ antiporter